MNYWFGWGGNGECSSLAQHGSVCLCSVPIPSCNPSTKWGIGQNMLPFSSNAYLDNRFFKVSVAFLITSCQNVSMYLHLWSPVVPSDSPSQGLTSQVVRPRHDSQAGQNFRQVSLLHTPLFT